MQAAGKVALRELGETRRIPGGDGGISPIPEPAGIGHDGGLHDVGRGLPFTA